MKVAEDIKSTLNWLDEGFQGEGENLNAMANEVTHKILKEFKSICNATTMPTRMHLGSNYVECEHWVKAQSYETGEAKQWEAQKPYAQTLDFVAFMIKNYYADRYEDKPYSVEDKQKRLARMIGKMDIKYEVYSPLKEAFGLAEMDGG